METLVPQIIRVDPSAAASDVLGSLFEKAGASESLSRTRFPAASVKTRRLREAEDGRSEWISPRLVRLREAEPGTAVPAELRNRPPSLLGNAPRLELCPGLELET
jgi:hypothetical protein